MAFHRGRPRLSNGAALEEKDEIKRDAPGGDDGSNDICGDSQFSLTWENAYVHQQNTVLDEDNCRNVRELHGEERLGQLCLLVEGYVGGHASEAVGDFTIVAPTNNVDHKLHEDKGDQFANLSLPGKSNIMGALSAAVSYTHQCRKEHPIIRATCSSSNIAGPETGCDECCSKYKGGGGSSKGI